MTNDPKLSQVRLLQNDCLIGAIQTVCFSIERAVGQNSDAAHTSLQIEQATAAGDSAYDCCRGKRNNDRDQLSPSWRPLRTLQPTTIYTGSPTFSHRTLTS